MESKNPPAIPLQCCLCCGYSLSGLPVSHECPECGFPYDPRSTAIELDNEPSYPWVAFHCIAVAIVFYAFFKAQTRQMIALLVVFALTEAAIGWLMRTRFRSRLIIDTRGLHRVRSGRVQEFVFWEDLAGLKYSRIDGALLAQARSGATIALTRNAKIAKECRRDVERAWFEFHANPLPAKETNLFA